MVWCSTGVVLLWWCFFGGVVSSTEVVFFWWCGGVFLVVAVFLWWCGGVLVVVFLWWCSSGGVLDDLQVLTHAGRFILNCVTSSDNSLLVGHGQMRDLVCFGPTYIFFFAYSCKGVVAFVVVFFWWCFCGCGVAAFLCCVCGGVFVAVFLWWCSCGGVLVMVFLWWCGVVLE